MYLFVIFYALLTFKVTEAKSSSGECLTGSEFKCLNGKCIPISWRCDGDRDCANDEDEMHCDNLVCNNTEDFRCSSDNSGLPFYAGEVKDRYTQCIPKSWVCDGEPDCKDGSDENSCTDAVCKEDQFSCMSYDGRSRICLPIEWKCDGSTDCKDGIDEQNCTDVKKCADDEFLCLKGICIFKRWKCDGDDDCGDGSDEQDCPPNKCDAKEKFQCATDNICIPHSWVCDGEHDCPDRSDEINCNSSQHRQPYHHVVTCHDNESRCRSQTQCINKSWVCDGDVDCYDGSDEENCQPVKCGLNEKQCNHGACLPEKKWCDGVEDCIDGSDEKDCINVAKSSQPKECDQWQYKCPGTPLECINLDSLCVDNGNNNDCVSSVCSKNITFCDEGKPNCKCRKMRNNAKLCYCPRGYNSVSGECKDIDECQSFGVCPQKCINTDGGYRCECYPGYRYHERKTKSGTVSLCRAIGSDPFILLSNRATIRGFDLYQKKYKTLVASVESAVAMDFLHRTGTLIWSDVSSEKIFMCQMGKEKTLHEAKNCESNQNELVLIDKDIVTPDGLAIDWVHELLFWTDAGLNQINVLDLVSRKRRTLFNDGLDEPRAIAVDPSRGLIFWSDWGLNARIERAGMDGSNRKAIISGDKIQWPNGIALDIMDRHIFWADAKLKIIMTCDYDGQGVKLILRSHDLLRHPFSLAVFEDRLYWTDWDSDGVVAANKYNGKEVEKIMRGVSGPMTVRVYHEAVQPNHPNKCQNHDCHHLCLPRPHLPGEEGDKLYKKSLPYACACANGFVFRSAGDSYCVLKPEASRMTGTNESTSFSVSTMFFFLMLSVFTIAAYLWYRRRPNRFVILHIDNPVYRRTVEEVDGDVEAFTDGVAPNSVSQREVELVFDSEQRERMQKGQPASVTNLTESMTAPLTSSMVL